VRTFKNKSVISYLRTLKTWNYPHLLLRAVLRPRAAAAPAVQQSVDISYPPGPQQQTRRTLLQRTNGTGRQTVRRDEHLAFHMGHGTDRLTDRLTHRSIA